MLCQGPGSTGSCCIPVESWASRSAWGDQTSSGPAITALQTTPGQCNVVGVKGLQKHQPISFPPFTYRKHLVPNQVVHPETKTIRFERGWQCFRAALWRIGTLISLSVSPQCPGTTKPGFVTWSVCVSARTKRKGKRESSVLSPPLSTNTTFNKAKLCLN